MRSKLPQLLILLIILLGLPVGVYLVGRATGFFGRAGGVPANLVVDLSASFSKSPLVWQNLAQKTVEHVSGKAGLNLSNVYYEVWNEPDLFGGYKVYGGKNYLDLYSHS